MHGVLKRNIRHMSPVLSSRMCYLDLSLYPCWLHNIIQAIGVYIENSLSIGLNQFVTVNSMWVSRNLQR